MCGSTLGVKAADVPSANSRSSLYNRGAAVSPSSSVSSEIDGVHSRLRSFNPGDPGEPDLGGGVGVIPGPIGDIPAVILLAAGLAYAGFAFVRRRKTVN